MMLIWWIRSNYYFIRLLKSYVFELCNYQFYQNWQS